MDSDLQIMEFFFPLLHNSKRCLTANSNRYKTSISKQAENQRTFRKERIWQFAISWREANKLKTNVNWKWICRRDLKRQKDSLVIVNQVEVLNTKYVWSGGGGGESDMWKILLHTDFPYRRRRKRKESYLMNGGKILYSLE